MSIYEAKVSLDMCWSFTVEADDEDAAYEELWRLIGYDGEDIIETDHDPDSEYFDVRMRLQ